jgi:hypothetical protein
MQYIIPKYPNFVVRSTPTSIGNVAIFCGCLDLRVEALSCCQFCRRQPRASFQELIKIVRRLPYCNDIQGTLRFREILLRYLSAFVWAMVQAAEPQHIECSLPWPTLPR